MVNAKKSKYLLISFNATIRLFETLKPRFIHLNLRYSQNAEEVYLACWKKSARRLRVKLLIYKAIMKPYEILIWLTASNVRCSIIKIFKENRPNLQYTSTPLNQEIP